MNQIFQLMTTGKFPSTKKIHRLKQWKTVWDNVLSWEAEGRNRTVPEHQAYPGIVDLLVSQSGVWANKSWQNFSHWFLLPDGGIGYFSLHLPNLSHVSKCNILASFSDHINWNTQWALEFNVSSDLKSQWITKATQSLLLQIRVHDTFSFYLKRSPDTTPWQHDTLGCGWGHRLGGEVPWSGGVQGQVGGVLRVATNQTNRLTKVDNTHARRREAGQQSGLVVLL